MTNHLREITIAIPKDLYDQLDTVFEKGVKANMIPAEAEHSDFYKFCFIVGVQQAVLEIAYRNAQNSPIIIPGGNVDAAVKAVNDYDSRKRQDQPQIIQ